MGILFFENYEKGLCRARSMAPYKHVIHYDPHSGFQYYNLLSSPFLFFVFCFFFIFVFTFLIVLFCFVVVVLLFFGGGGLSSFLCPMLPVSLNYPFVIAPSDNSNVY